MTLRSVSAALIAACLSLHFVSGATSSQPATPDGGSSGEPDVVQDPGITSTHLEVGGQPSHLLGEVGTRPAVGSDVADMPMMQMKFYAGYHLQLWFKGFDVSSPGELAAACIGVVLLASLYEGLKVGRVILADQYKPEGYASAGHLLQTLLHLVQVATSYFLMLAAMTFNSYIFMSICGGAALGYYLFAKLLVTDSYLGSSSECHH